MKKVTIVLMFLFVMSGNVFASPYIKGSFSFSSLEDSETTFNNTEVGEVKTDVGWGIRAETGWNFGNGISSGIEYSYLDFEADEFKAKGGREFKLDDNIDFHTVLFNATYAHDFGSQVKPYIGTGLGFAIIDDAKDTEFAFQVNTGLSFSLNSQIDLLAGYKYLMISDFENEEFQNDKVEHEVDIHNFELGIKYNF